MLGGGDRAYVYAKSCGIISSSFFGKGTSRLDNLTRLSELDRLIFSKDARELPERELLRDLEWRIVDRSAKQIITLINSYHKPPEFFSRLVRSFEYADLKTVLSSLIAGIPGSGHSVRTSHGGAETPYHTDIGKFTTIHYKAYPNMEAMLQGTEFTFLLNELPKQGSLAFKEINITALQTKLDRFYYKTLWDSMLKLARRDRLYIGKILSEELSLRNAAWVLRLRTYYDIEADEAGECLIHIKAGEYGSGDLADDAKAALTLPLDNAAAWKKWKWAEFLNPSQLGEAWTADPRYFQNAAAIYLYRQAYHYFHMRPFSLDVLSCFIKLKQFEADLLTSVAEGLSLGMNSREIMHVLGAAS
jgi:vacuolar-type H+-ATPase subunit C/Vma6